MSYLSYKQLAKLSEGVGVFIVSTKEGFLPNNLCLKRKTGGTVLCYLI
jgi:ribosomal protein S8